jgi:hypothetical protein
MRSISTAGLATLAKNLGNEPITIVQVDWGNTLPTQSYADRTLGVNPVIPGKIIEVGDLDNVTDVSVNTRSEQLSLTLDDTDGSIKAIFDSIDIQNSRVRVYQYFDGLDLSDMFLVFSGQINTPISWSEHDRTVKFNVLSQIEDLEVGFSAEEGNFQYLPSDLVGKAWPMIFGLVMDCPALKVDFGIQGVTLGPVSILTGVNAFLAMAYYQNPLTAVKFDMGLAMMSIQRQMASMGADCWMNVDNAKAQQFLDQENKIESQMVAAVTQKEIQERCAYEKRLQQVNALLQGGLGDNPVQILGGEDFPQNQTITLNINGGLFTGYFQGQTFYIQGSDDPQADLQWAEQQIRLADPCPPPGGMMGQSFHYSIAVPCDGYCGGFGDPCHYVQEGIILSSHPISNLPVPQPTVKLFWADAGARVVMGPDTPTTFIASITPGQVLVVKAFQTLGGIRRLTVVPSSLYTVSTQNYGGINAVQITLVQQLSTLLNSNSNGLMAPYQANQGWEDQLYVTFQSTIGPNVVDILTYIVENYSNLSCDSTTFSYVRTKLIPFPANFALLDRKNVLDVLKEIAFQVRCAVWIENQIVYLKYLPEEPTPVDTITVSDIDAEHGVEVELTETEKLVTKMNIRWRLGYSPEPGDQAEQMMVLRHNMTRYGLHEQSYDWYCFNQPDIILKMATFWLIRYSQTWKRIKFRTFLNKLNLETFDCITFNVPGQLVSGEVNLMIEKASYNSAENCIDFECEAPVKAGTMVQYPFYWPSSLSVDQTWPPPDEIAIGDAGGGVTGVGGELPIGFTDTIGTGGTVWVGGPNVIYTGNAGWGDPTPTDVGFQAQPVTDPSYYGQVGARSGQPELDLAPYYISDLVVPSVPGMPVETVIDLSTTKVMDSKSADPTQVGYLRNVFQVVADHGVVVDIEARVVSPESDDPGALDDVLAVKQGQLMLQPDTQVITDGAEDGAPFDFKYDPVGGKVGAGTAFLQDSSSGSSGSSGGS